jgi:2,7-dihydroxy-5-methyl-1-naphthoate 7-O-methyltransferase
VTDVAASSGVDLWALSDLETPWCLRVVATLRIADHIAAGNAAIAALARAAGADADALQRVLRHLVGRGIFLEPAPGEFALNGAAALLRDDHPSGLRFGLDLDGIGGRMAGAWGSLLSAVRTGRPAYAEVYGRPFWEDLDTHPAIAASFDALMGPAGHGLPDPEVLLDADWDAVHTVVDVGGGTGTLLAEVLRAHPPVRGTLVDLPRTVARSGDTFRSAGVADRVTTAGQSFFDPLPAGADLYLLKNVLGDWPDPEASTLLRRCAEAARPGGRVVILGGISPEDAAAPSPELLMLLLVGGKSRSLDEFRALARDAGLAITAAGRQPSGRFVVECRPV